MEVKKSKRKVSWPPDQEGKRRKTNIKGKGNKAKLRRVRKGGESDTREKGCKNY